VKGSRNRVWYKSCGERAKLVIRRLYCERCNKIHHELPDLLIPYRRYDASSIEEAVVEGDQIIVAADESTIARWRYWFLVWSMYAVRCLSAIAARFGLSVGCSSASPQTAHQQIGRYVEESEGWLSRAVRRITNSLFWLQTRSAFLSALS
jgi:hypothetical protein